MSVARKLQLKPGQGVVVLGRPADVDLDVDPDDLVEDHRGADAALVFVTSAEDLATPDVDVVVDAARRDVLAWVAYPKARRLGTDLNRDSLAARLSARGVRPVRQISLDDTWSALRFRPA
jgi:hypothetical protein